MNTARHMPPRWTAGIQPIAPRAAKTQAPAPRFRKFQERSFWSQGRALPDREDKKRREK